MTGSSPRRAPRDVSFIAGGAALFAAAFLHWVRRGPGSTLRGHDLIDAVGRVSQHAHWSDWRITAISVLWYAVPASGALGWIVVGYSHPASRPGRLAAALALTSSAITVVAIATVIGWSRLGIGAYCASIGALMLAAGTTSVPGTTSGRSRVLRRSR